MTRIVLDIALVVAGTCLCVAIALVLRVLLRGPGTADRAIALDMLGMLLVAIAAVVAIAADAPALVDAAIGIALLGFLAALAVARLVERHARDGDRDG